MYIATWPSLKSSPMMAEIRQALKKKAGKGEPPIPNKEANRTWREDVLGILSEDQKKERKQKRQEKNNKSKFREVVED
jgi:hypothetical protein